MTEEEIKALQEAKEEAARIAAEAKAAAELARAEAEKAKLDLTKVVDELKEERQKKNEALSKAQINNEGQDVQAQIERALAEREAARQKAEVEAAIAEFKNSKPEFQSDSSGLVFGKFQKTLDKFNLSGITNKSEAKAFLEDVYRFANNTNRTEDAPAHSGTPSLGGSTPASNNQQTKDIEKISSETGMPVDKVSALRSKYSDAFQGLGL